MSHMFTLDVTYIHIYVRIGMLWVLTLWLMGLRAAPRMTASNWQEVCVCVCVCVCMCVCGRFSSCFLVGCVCVFGACVPGGGG